MRKIAEILELARWAPSGDNTQPWRFEVGGEPELVVHGFDARDHCVYDLDGRASQLALEALLETLRIAATAHGLSPQIRRLTDAPDETPTFVVTFTGGAAAAPDPLIDFIRTRTVQRRPLSPRSMRADQKSALEAAVAPRFEILWLEGLAARSRVTKLMFRNAKLRLTTPEAYEVHRSVIEWNARFSEDRIPESAVGVDPLTGKLMRWVMKSWSRVEFSTSGWGARSCRGPSWTLSLGWLARRPSAYSPIRPGDHRLPRSGTCRTASGWRR